MFLFTGEDFLRAADAVNQVAVAVDPAGGQLLLIIGLGALIDQLLLQFKRIGILHDQSTFKKTVDAIDKLIFLNLVDADSLQPRPIART